MKLKKTIVVSTSIRVPRFLKDVCENAIAYGRDNISFIIIGDKKTPLEAKDFCNSIAENHGFPISYYDLEQQETYLRDFPSFLKIMPYNSGARKMVGNLIAYLEGAETLIMLDDDNYVTNQDFFGNYAVVGEETNMQLFQAGSGWFNVYESIIEEKGLPIFPRGYPWSYRFTKGETITKVNKNIRVAVKNGLVLEDPDIDAISRLFWPIRILGMKTDYEPHFGLYPGTWSSFNNQNTAISRNLIPVFYTPAGTGRNADIWTSYVICCLASHMNEAVSYGYPLVRQFRNVHNLWKDLEDEQINNRATDYFVNLLRSANLTEKNYLCSLEQLISSCLEKLSSEDELPEEEKEMIFTFFKEFGIWLECLKTVSGTVAC